MNKADKLFIMIVAVCACFLYVNLLLCLSAVCPFDLERIP